MTIFQNKPPPKKWLNHFTTARKMVSEFWGKNGMNKK